MTSHAHLRILWLGLLAALFLSASLTWAQETFVYTQAETEQGPKELQLDFYPAAETCATPRPTVVFLHPGAFRWGGRKDLLVYRLAPVFRENGFNFVSISYRLLRNKPVLSDRYTFVAEQFSVGGVISEDTRAAAAVFEDTVAALDFLTERAEALCIDTDGLVLSGASAGSIAALNVTYALDAFGIEVPPIAAVINLWGGFLPDRAMQVGDAPLFIVHGQNDPVLSFEEAEKLWQQANATNTPVQMYTFNSSRHGVRITRRVQQDPLTELIGQFAVDAVNREPMETFRVDS